MQDNGWGLEAEINGGKSAIAYNNFKTSHDGMVDRDRYYLLILVR
jgi:hypothetical protein